MLTNEEKSLSQQILDKLEQMEKRLEKMERYLERQKGFIGGVLFIGAGIAWVIGTIKDYWK